MRDHARWWGTAIGTFGAQAVTLALFALLGESCCGAEVPGCPHCLWGHTFGEYWTNYAAPASVICAVVGYFIGRRWEAP